MHLVGLKVRSRIAIDVASQLIRGWKVEVGDIGTVVMDQIDKERPFGVAFPQMPACLFFRRCEIELADECTDLRSLPTALLAAI